jgi:hypothetical protein
LDEITTLKKFTTSEHQILELEGEEDIKGKEGKKQKEKKRK